MRDSYYDPPEEIEPPECCGEDTEIEGDAAICLKCGNRFVAEPDIDDPSVDEPFEPYEPELNQECPHGKSDSCNACGVASDLAYDAAREKRYR